jgi:Prolyl oligopeptidase, N-terminal beta-propeller domain
LITIATWKTLTIHTINSFNPSGDGKYLIYLVSANGSEDASLYVLDTQTFQDIDAPISRTVESTCWLPDNRSFFYHRLQEMKEGMAAIERYQKSQTYWHRLGTDLEQDKVVLQHGSAPLENISPTDWPCITRVSSSYAIATKNGIGIQYCLCHNRQFSAKHRRRSTIAKSDTIARKFQQTILANFYYILLFCIVKYFLLFQPS